MSGCDVCIGGGDYDGVLEFQEVSHPKARKDHKCEECRAVIPVGQKYQKIVGKVDGDFTETKTCLMCAEIREVFACGEITVLGELWEDFRNAEVFDRLNHGDRVLHETVSTGQVLPSRPMAHMERASERERRQASVSQDSRRERQHIRRFPPQMRVFEIGTL